MDLSMVARAQKRPHVFISHVPKDEDFVRQLARALSRSGFETWSMDNVYPGDNAYLKIGKALEAADAMVVVLSPEAVESPTLSIEVGYALGSERFAHRVIPVQIRKSDNFPWILNEFQIISTSNPRIAAKKIIARLRQPIEV
jgi:hypothetical protein